MKIETEKQMAFVKALEEADAGASIKFFKNCDNPGLTLKLIEYAPFSEVFLSWNSFCWVSSPEGVDYWAHVSRRFRGAINVC